jgi:hypothetical protein
VNPDQHNRLLLTGGLPSPLLPAGIKMIQDRKQPIRGTYS